MEPKSADNSLKVHYNAWQAIKSMPAKESEIKLVPLADLRSDIQFQSVFKELFGAADGESQQTTASRFEQIYGKDEQNFTKTYCNDVNKYTIKQKVGATPQETRLDTLSNPKDVTAILNAYEGQAARRQAEALAAAKIKPNVITKTMEEVCAGLKGEEACKTNDNCKYGKEKCVLRANGEKEAGKEAGKANQETGENEGKTECKKHDNKKDCEAENEGLADNAPRKCGWIDYVDGTGKLPKPECRSSSFFVNKQLALSMAYTFVSLI
uniref:Variant surface glycoprotein 1125.5670 n=1 Tax=Trypanosoma brucei TaxID=5691 RepID=A0A1J0RD13_9TRYP|nr:variant surface glycoprotein 1125.5670 [Trypanosoma brucei]